MNKSPANQREGDCRHSNDQIIHKTTAILFFFIISPSSFVDNMLFFSTRISVDHKYNVHDNQTTWLQQNNVFRFFFWVRQTKKAENYFITVITSVRTYRNVHWSMSELQTKKSNNAKIIVCWCRANEAEAQPKPKPTPKPILLNIV